MKIELVVQVNVAASELDQFLSVSQSLAQRVRDEELEAVIAYGAYSMGDSINYLIQEIYRDEQALIAHMERFSTEIAGYVSLFTVERIVAIGTCSEAVALKLETFAPGRFFHYKKPV